MKRFQIISEEEFRPGLEYLYGSNLDTILESNSWEEINDNVRIIINDSDKSFGSDPLICIADNEQKSYYVVNHGNFKLEDELQAKLWLRSGTLHFNPA